MRTGMVRVSVLPNQCFAWVFSRKHKMMELLDAFKSLPFEIRSKEFRPGILLYQYSAIFPSNQLSVIHHGRALKHLGNII